ncbi:MAG: hypothetical protein JO013_15590 [Alphaproteobacteria bacterium]|nr:hypothetical protein [Alphaproteobacteria bacterium]
MRGSRAALLPATAALLGLAAAPAAAAGSEGFGQICTAGGAVPAGTPAPGRDRSHDTLGCAHAVCPRGLLPPKRRAGRG